LIALLLGWLLAVNIVAIGVFRADKRAAGAGRRRVPERVLLILAAAGAAPGLVWATYRFRHKTRKEPFRTLLRLILAAELAGVALALALFV
jgi:uncharacterized membrane protein YsdA (DUF1294 family)